MKDIDILNIKKLFDQILEPKLKWNINTLGLLKRVEFVDEKLLIEVHLIANLDEFRESFETEVKNLISKIYQGELELIIKQAYVATSGIEGVGKIILVASGKGGVGKSTVSVNLATALSKQNLKVGLLDADIYGPSIPIMLGCQDKHPVVMDNENLMPIDIHGIKFISIGSLVPKDKAINWRGQLVSGTIIQFIKKTVWDKLDYLVIDMPPGTGDIHLTIASKVKADGVIVVTTPQEVVWGDVKRSLDLLNDEKFPIIGIVENMSYTICEECGHKNYPFNSAKDIVKDIPIIAKLPLTREISETSDNGIPYVLAKQDDEVTKIYTELANKVINFN